MMKLRLLFATFVLFIVYGCCGEAAPGRQWIVTGTVLDDNTAEPIADASVTIFVMFGIEGQGGRTFAPVTTDAQGRFTADEQFFASCLGGDEIFISDAAITDGTTDPSTILVLVGDGDEGGSFGQYDATPPAVEFEDIPGFGVKMTINLQPLRIRSSQE